ncbi:hydroxyacylglutathione hydrolase [Acanthamoeba castellanii str. Neff]|uniref:hydroxyacylglutathione hydrolase n=1 Tax=Acanthamoeba castellanii (strain ATCC 30010 / Neff) TaxID=1257118 RepID=L8GM47_ACACF|nr:hydroxyacylglutathione hydrolase [Acanthamoeba castellanii str. Neff]ELR14062.1 hydroxyacylglutathione hydrolase [Acanthamoeba castellanii str. Neff]
MSTYRVVPVPVLSDNYAYLLIDERDKVAAAVDPVEPKKVLEAAEKEGVPIKAIYTTHHHWDHAGGNEELLKALPAGTPVYGADDRIPGLTHKVANAEVLQLGSTGVKVLFTPCHTAGHVLMYHALHDVCAQLPQDTQVWCGHEYTVKNLQFAQSVEKDNQELQAKLKWAEERRSQEPPLPTIPSTIHDELQCNPFMRVNRESVKRALGLATEADPIEVMAKLRHMKDKW